MGYPIFINPSRVFALSELAPSIQQYRAAWKEAGHPGEGEIGLRVPIYLAETAERAYKEPMESTIGSISNMGQRFAASASRAGTTGNWQAEADHILGMTYDDWVRDKVLFGTPEAVVDRLLELREELHLNQVVFENNFGRRIPYDLQMNSLRLMMERVVPKLK